MSVHAITVDDVSEYVAKISKLEQRHIAQWFFRGHSDSRYRLQPSLFRLDTEGSFASWEAVEKYMMDAFKAEATPHLIHKPENEEEWLALAQHYGLPTRLLDWTTNPLVALYFAVEDSPCAEGNVWCAGFPSTNNCLPESTHLARRLTLTNTRIIYFPRHVSPRVTNQSGCFTVHGSPEPMDEAGPGECPFSLVKFVITPAKKAAILNELYTLGIHRGFIYPGLEGIAKRLRFEVTTKHYRHTNLELG